MTLLQEAAIMIERFKDQLLIHSEKRPTREEVETLLRKIYESNEPTDGR